MDKNLCRLSQLTLPCRALFYVQGQGSGFVWDNQGHIVTNFHVIRGAAEVQVTLLDQTVHKAKIVGGESCSSHGHPWFAVSQRRTAMFGLLVAPAYTSRCCS